MRAVRTLVMSSQLSSAAQWSTAQKAVQKLVPPLTFDSRKGQNGRIGVLGGSYEYTGAPYYAASAALQAGADLAYVFCADGAAPAIKSYSPELIVLPCYKTAMLHDREAVAKAMQEVRPWLGRLDCCVIGPGLGRDAGVLEGVAALLACEEVRCAIVDADGKEAPYLARKGAVDVFLGNLACVEDDAAAARDVARLLMRLVEDGIAELVRRLEQTGDARAAKLLAALAADGALAAEIARRGDEHEDIASCASCHEGGETDGLSPERADTPRIAGQDGYWIVNWLEMYRDGPVPETPRAHLMQAAAERLSDDNIADLAAYYASLGAE